MKNYTRIYLILIFTLSCITAHSQVTIGWDTPAEKAALLEIKSQNPTSDGGATSSAGGGGILLPRVLLTNMNELLPFINKDNISQAEYERQKNIYKGLVVYNLTTSGGFAKGVYTWDGAKWKMASGDNNTGTDGSWALAGNRGTNSTINYLGTNDEKALSLKTKKTEILKISETGSIGINNPAPTTDLEINADAKLDSILYLKGIKPAPTGDDVSLSLLLKHNGTGQVYSTPGPGKNIRPYTFLKYIITNLNRAQGGIKCVVNTQIPFKDYTLVVVGSSFQTTPASRGLKVSMSNGGDYNPQSVYAYLDTQSGAGNETWALSADYPGGQTANGNPGTWTIYCLAINSSLIKSHPQQSINMNGYAIGVANPIEGL